MLPALGLGDRSALAAKYPLSQSAQPAVRTEKIRVRLAEAVPKVPVRGFDLRLLQGEGELVTVADRLSQWDLVCQDGRIRAVPQVGGETLELKEPVTLESPAGFLTFRGRPYRDTLRVYTVGSLCEVVNEVDIEKYLDGLVNAEFSSRWSEEAIAAQVVAARTYALYQVRQSRHHPDSHYDVDSTVKDQVYDGSLKEDYRASRSVERTRGLVLTVDQGEYTQPIKAFYHSTCGGKTELPENVWGASYRGFKRQVVCPFCRSSPRYQWRLDMKSSEIAEAVTRGIQRDGLLADWSEGALDVVLEGRLVDLQPEQSRSAGRVERILTVWARGARQVQVPVPAVKFREWIGPSRLLSTAFDIVVVPEREGSRWHFSGHGNGHGVGMCQWGAKVMSEKGYSLAAILRYYYPDAILRKLW